MNDLEPYEIARAVDSDDDHPIGELTESDVEMLRHIFPVEMLRHIKATIQRLSTPLLAIYTPSSIQW
jgi:hypothetical protein